MTRATQHYEVNSELSAPLQTNDDYKVVMC